ncbi:MAG: hypothetical protein RJB38_1752, partial [Pseudomonadota bacterium]
TFLVLLAGCRFENLVVPEEDPAKLSGFYRSEAQSMSICAILEGKDWRCADAATEIIPSVIQSIMTDPVYISANSTRAKAFLVPKTLDTTRYFEMKLSKAGDLSSEPVVGESKPMWSDQECLSQMQMAKDGRIAPSTPTKEGDLSIAGRVELSIAVITALSEQCGPTLLQLKACYLEAKNCPGNTPQEQADEQSAVQSYFSPYLSHGVLTVDEIPQLMSFGWEATYR